MRAFIIVSALFVAGSGLWGHGYLSGLFSKR